MKIWYVDSRDKFFMCSLYQGTIRYHEIWAVIVPRIRPRNVSLQLENCRQRFTTDFT